MQNESTPRTPSLLDAFIPIITLIGLLALSVYLFGDNSSAGANQIALIVSAAVAMLVGMKNGHRWHEMEEAIAHGISVSTTAILILLAVGSLIGVWILCGTVPTLIYYGLHILSPQIFYAATCLICAVVALSIGSSWTVAGTIGVALVGVAGVMGMSLPITAGAIISGAYFGDKMSPLSDTTNLAPAVAGSKLFDHIRHMTWTTFPSLGIALILFAIVGVTSHHGTADNALGGTLNALDSQFHLAWYQLVPVAVVMFLAIRKMPALPTILLGALVGAIFAVLFQPDVVVAQAGRDDLARPMAMLAGVWRTLFDGFHSATGNGAVDALLTRGGMSSMLNTVWLILCAMTFGAVMDKTDLLTRLVRSLLKAAHSAGSLIIATLVTAVGANVIASDQYMSIVLPGRTYRSEFERRGLAPVNLSRALEDAGTLTSPLVPWNTCGAFMAATLGVATFAYLPFCFFNILNPIVAAIYAWNGIKIAPAEGALPDTGA
ncbi:MAG: Na+/H+ antiporter NhaC [Gammaproteobacteria bacterium]|jgi:NhaC family Na+:H+ antiporter